MSRIENAMETFLSLIPYMTKKEMCELRHDALIVILNKSGWWEHTTGRKTQICRQLDGILTIVWQICELFFKVACRLELVVIVVLFWNNY